MTQPANDMAASFTPDKACARQLDAADALAGYREQFLIPKRPDGTDVIYFCGNSLGLQPKSVRPAIEEELHDWATLAVDAHFDGRHPWFPYHEMFRESGARLVGGVPGEVVMMNGLTVNLHLLLSTFYRPTPDRFAILMEDCAFPSDTYAAQTQLKLRGVDPADGLIVARPREGEHTLRTEDIEALIDREGERIAVVLFAGVNYYCGQLFDMARITAAAHAKGCIAGFDLAHAAGNAVLSLHDWNVDFAAWCSYKYLNAGPGGVAGCFVHERHGQNTDLPRMGGWWGNDPQTRFRMHLEPEFVPRPGADGWQLSNPPILAMAALRASMEIFDDVGMAALRAKSERLTAYLQFLLDRMPSERYEVVTPRAPAERGCQFSILVHHEPKRLHAALQAGGVVCDFRPPNVVRIAPVPLYNTFTDVWRFAQILAEQTSP